MRKGRKEMRKLIIVAGATGVGKTSLERRVVDKRRLFQYIVKLYVRKIKSS